MPFCDFVSKTSIKSRTMCSAFNRAAGSIISSTEVAATSSMNYASERAWSLKSARLPFATTAQTSGLNSAEDALILYQCACGIFIENGTELKPNTLIVRKSESASFKNEGIIEAFITYFEDCKSVENKGNFTSRNLFLIRTDIQNYGMISWCDAYHNIDGNVKNLVGDNGKNGFIKMGKKTGNTYILKERNTCFDYTPFFLFKGSKEVPINRDNSSYSVTYHLKRNGYYVIVITGRIDIISCISGTYAIGDGKDFVNGSSSCELSEPPLVSLYCGSRQKEGFLFITRHNVQDGSISLRPLYKTDAHKWASNRYFDAIDDGNRALYFIYDNPNDHQTAQ